MKVNLCTDPTLVTSPCLRIRAAGFELYLWCSRWLPRVALTRAEP